MGPLQIGRIVHYVSRTGDYECPAIVVCAKASLSPKGVRAGHVPALSGAHNVHLVVFTPGHPGKRRDADNFLVESPHGRSENDRGTYQEWDIPHATLNSLPTDEVRTGHVPGTWHWPQDCALGWEYE